MKLVSLRLHNFRQFYGTSPLIKFAAERQQNVTLFLGDNGSGKTALLNAFIWVLYELHTSGFLLPDEIVNRRAILAADPKTYIEAWAELEFEHKEYLYCIKRTTKVYKTNQQSWHNNLESEVHLQVRGQDGTTHVREDVKDTIGKVLPQDLHGYFFFDGERIEKIVKQTKEEKAALAVATKKLLDLEVISRAFKHLNEVAKEFEKELKRIGDTETQQLLAQKEEAEKRLLELENDLTLYEGNLESHKKRKSEIEDKLRRLDEVKDLQQKRDQLNQRLEEIENERNTSHTALKKNIAENGYNVFIGDYFERYNAIVNNMRVKGDLPAGIKRQFVDDLLDQKICICGRCLDPETDIIAFGAVKKWLSRAGIGDVEEQIYMISAHVKQGAEKTTAFWQDMADYQEQEENYRTLIAVIEGDLDQIQEKILKDPREEVSQLQKQLIKTEENIDETKHNIWKTEEIVKQKNKQIKDLEIEIQIHELKEEEQVLVKKRLSATYDSENRLRQTYSLCDETLRKRLQAKIKKIFHQISITPYQVKLDQEYAISLYDQTGIIARSQGESQILSLSFIAGIVDLVREGSISKSDHTNPEDITYPIVMDSPFGTLDQTNRPRVVKHIDKIADQVIMMVSSTQWRGEVEQAALNNIGKTYLLTYYTPKEDFKRKITIVYRGKEYTLVQKSPSDFEYTQIIEVEHG